MSVFIDTGVFVAARNMRDINHKRAVKLLEKAIKGEYGEIFTSDYVFDEAVTVALVRTGRPNIAARTGQLILVMPGIRMVFVDEELFKDAWARFMRLAAKGLSFTDCVTLAVMDRYKIDYLLSFDKGFDGLVRRIC